jgi:hypothetical protein
MGAVVEKLLGYRSNTGVHGCRSSTGVQENMFCAGVQGFRSSTGVHV